MFNATTSTLQAIMNIPGASTETMSLYEYLSYVFGALYLSLWSLSFYPQLWENYKRNHTMGLSYDYALLQTFAYLLFCLYAFTGKIELRPFSTTPQPPVGLNIEPIDRADVAFASHAFLLSAALFT
jgi:cystinosin